MKTKRHRTAGGVVLDGANRVLTLVRDVERDGVVRHEVRLPKGHIDPGETARTAARREVGEESGYWDTKIVADLGEATSEFDFRGKHHVRVERYFLMRLASDVRGAPKPCSPEEKLFQPAWLTLAEARRVMTYPSEVEFVRRAAAWTENGDDTKD